MKPRQKKIVYWTTACLEPEIEAVSKEVSELAAIFKPAFIFAINPNILFKFSFQRRHIGFNHRFYPLLRLLVPILERWGHINHVYGNLCPWLFYKGLKKNSVIHTIASEQGDMNAAFLSKCKIIVVQTKAMMDRLISFGVDRKKIFLVYPGIDLKKFFFDRTYPSLSSPKVLFATAPRQEEELEERGVYVLLEAARLNTSIQYTFLFRKWDRNYTSFPKVRNFITAHGLTNVTLRNEFVADMAKEYRDHHFTIIPFIQENGGKQCPNSALESIASGRPVLVSEASAFSEFVRENHCGVVYNNTPQGIVQTICNSVSVYRKLVFETSGVASTFFDLTHYLSRYRRFYKMLNTAL
jgi:glycosyltransferase involved in cell wall biosynthesis